MNLGKPDGTGTRGKTRELGRMIRLTMIPNHAVWVAKGLAAAAKDSRAENMLDLAGWYEECSEGLESQVRGGTMGLTNCAGGSREREKSIGLTVTPDDAVLIARGLAAAANHTRATAKFPALSGFYDELSSSVYKSVQGQLMLMQRGSDLEGTQIDDAGSARD